MRENTERIYWEMGKLDFSNRNHAIEEATFLSNKTPDSIVSYDNDRVLLKYFRKKLVKVV